MRFFSADLSIAPKKLAAAILLTSGTLSWFFLLNLYMQDIFRTLSPNDSLWAYYNVGQILFYGFAISCAILGSFIGGRINRRKLLIFSITLGTFSTVLLALSQGTILSALSTSLVGASFGLGLPSSMALIADDTVIEERARVSGIVILSTFVIAFSAMAAIRILALSILSVILLFAVVRSISFLALAIDKCDRPKEETSEKTYAFRIHYKEFFYYLIPWVMFSVAAGLAWNLIPPTTEYANAQYVGTTLRYVSIAAFGLISGIAADKFGRKQPIIIGLITLGISFLLLGLFNMSPTAVLIYLSISGIAWGSFFVVFLAVPGDLSVSTSREKFYGLGYILPLAIMFTLWAVPGPAFLAGFAASLLSQILGIILFLSIIPVLRAKETLSSQKIQERKMKHHVDEIRKLVQKSKEKR